MRVTLRQEEALVYTLTFTVKRSCLVFVNVSSDIIRKVTVGYVGSSGPGLRNQKRPHIQGLYQELSRIMMTVMLRL